MNGVFHRSISQFSCRITRSLHDLETPRGWSRLENYRTRGWFEFRDSAILELVGVPAGISPELN